MRSRQITLAGDQIAFPGEKQVKQNIRRGFLLRLRHAAIKLWCNGIDQLFFARMR